MNANEHRVWRLTTLPAMGPSYMTGQQGQSVVFVVLVVGVVAGLAGIFQFNWPIRSFFLIFLPFLPAALLAGWFVGRGKMKRWSRFAERDEVERTIVQRELDSEGASYLRMCAVVQRVWKPYRRAAWDQIPEACAHFGLETPRAIVLDSRGVFDDYPRAFSDGEVPDEPVEIGRPGGERGWTGAIVTGIAGAAIMATSLSFIGAGFVSIITLACVAFVIVLIESRSPVRWTWRAWLSESIIASPGAVHIAKPSREAANFHVDDSVLMLRDLAPGGSRVRVDIARPDGQRAVLRFEDPGDPRLHALWTLWNHPRACHWDGEAAQILPDAAQPSMNLD